MHLKNIPPFLMLWKSRAARIKLQRNLLPSISVAVKNRVIQPVSWNSTFFAFSLIIEGTTEKVLQCMLPLKSIYNKTLVSLNKKCIFEHCREFQARKTLFIDIIFATKKNIC
jgi:hypothetical protein